jgi:hypothetical protein
MNGEIDVSNQSPIEAYVQFMGEFLGELGKILQAETISKLESFC